MRPLAAGQQSLPRLPGKPAWPGLARPGHGSGPRAAPNCASFIRIADLFAISAGLSNLGLNALAAAISTPLAAPVIVGMRLRGGNAASARGAASFAAPTDAAPARGGGHPARRHRLYDEGHRGKGLRRPGEEPNSGAPSQIMSETPAEDGAATGAAPFISRLRLKNYKSIAQCDVRLGR